MQSRSALLAAGVTVVLWASAFVVIRSVGAYVAPGPMALGRLVVGMLALSAVALRRPVRLPRGRPLLLVAGYGALWCGLYMVVLSAAERHLDAGTSALLVNVAPIIVAVAAGLFLGEGFPPALTAGIAVAFAGVVVIAVATATGRHDGTGVLLALAAAGLYALGVLLQKQAIATVDPITATWLGTAIGMLVCLPYAPALIRTIGDVPPRALAGIAYLGIFPTAVAFSTWAYALRHTTAGRLTATTYLAPGIAVLLSWLFLHETPAPLALAGGAACLLGVALTRLPPRPAPLPPQWTAEPAAETG